MIRTYITSVQFDKGIMIIRGVDIILLRFVPEIGKVFSQM